MFNGCGFRLGKVGQGSGGDVVDGEAIGEPLVAVMECGQGNVP
jgi:hypothetical protein